MSIRISHFLDSNEYDRQAALNAWLQLKGLSKVELAKRLGVHPSMVSRIVSGQRSPAKRIEALVKMGIPAELLPKPSNRGRGRPCHRQTQDTAEA